MSDEKAREVIAGVKVKATSPDTGEVFDGIKVGSHLADAILSALAAAGLTIFSNDDLREVRHLAGELQVAFNETDKKRWTAGEIAAAKLQGLLLSRVVQFATARSTPGAQP